jgi:chloramphenicol 3-O-phosphotransferase
LLDSMLVLWAALTVKSSGRAARDEVIHKAAERRADAAPGVRRGCQRRPGDARKWLIRNGYSCCAAIF